MANKLLRHHMIELFPRNQRWRTRRPRNKKPIIGVRHYTRSTSHQKLTRELPGVVIIYMCIEAPPPCSVLVIGTFKRAAELNSVLRSNI